MAALGRDGKGLLSPAVSSSRPLFSLTGFVLGVRVSPGPGDPPAALPLPPRSATLEQQLPAVLGPPGPAVPHGVRLMRVLGGLAASWPCAPVGPEGHHTTTVPTWASVFPSVKWEERWDLWQNSGYRLQGRWSASFLFAHSSNQCHLGGTRGRYRKSSARIHQHEQHGLHMDLINLQSASGRAGLCRGQCQPRPCPP